METLFSILAGVSLLIGAAAILTGSLGLLRLPDVFSRIHAVGLIDTAGAGFIILGMLFYSGFTLVSLKLAAIGVFLFFTSPIATHAVAQVAHRNGVEPQIADVTTPAPKTAAPKAAATKKTATKTAATKKTATKKAASKAKAKSAKRATK